MASLGTDAARADVYRWSTSSPRHPRATAITRMRDDAESCRGKGTGGWTDGDIDDYVAECNRQLGDGTH